MDLDVSRLQSPHGARTVNRPGPVRLTLRRIFRGVRLRKLEPFYFQLSTMISAGVTITDALHTLAEQNKGRTRDVFEDLAETVAAGGELTPAMERYPETFDRYTVAMARTGEQTGSLDENLELVGHTIERFRNIRGKIITGLLYPVVLLHAAVLVPNLVVLFMKGLGPYLEVCVKTLIPIYLVVIGVWFAHQVLRQTRAYSKFILGMFFFGGVAKKVALARFSRALASMHDAGVPLGVAVETAGEASTNGAIQESFAAVSDRLLAGNSFIDSLAGIRYMTPLVLNMVETGERSGRLGDTLRKVADYYDHEAYTAIDRAARIIPIFIYIVIAGHIAMQVIAFYGDRYGMVF